MLKEKININAKVLYCGLECSLVEVISENRLKLEIPTVDGQLQLLPPYTQGTCWIYTETAVFRAKAEVLERYKSDNRCVMELELKSGLYQMSGHDQLWADLLEDGVISLGKEPESRLDVRVCRASAEGMIFCLPDGQRLSDSQLEAGREFACLTFRQMELEGTVEPLPESEKEGCYGFSVGELPLEIQKKLSEIVLLEAK